MEFMIMVAKLDIYMWRNEHSVFRQLSVLCFYVVPLPLWNGLKPADDPTPCALISDYICSERLHPCGCSEPAPQATVVLVPPSREVVS
jgi:hypothetical protein